MNRKKQSMILIAVLLLLTAIIYFMSPSGVKPKSATGAEAVHTMSPPHLHG